ncbi:C2 domain-containing protein At1g53590-like isoform X2 [Phoenix dactylifera]|uniref:C2 domain-containing protein At1g53590-like isoform X2 n=1 Tax=Phoenix dactylifera TaxID=42345 RepID=A0A8B9AE08_PHODC|nr:C2 domain-containing protein At1g53590-like isoform X2 [Phoenix dactylifera]
MDITEVSIVHHITLVLVLLWVCVSLGWAHPVVFFTALLYLYVVNERYSLRLRRRIQFEERKYANQQRLLSDTESVRWLNHAVEKIWPICMEQIASQQFLLPVIPWFLDKFKPWTVKAAVEHLYLGRTPPMFTDIRVLRDTADDDHLVLELGMNFLSADDMSAILAVQLRKRVGLGITANMHVTGMHVEGKVLVGMKFLRSWPFIGRVRVCFVEPPYFQMTVKPIFGHGLDVTELPGISGWLDKMLDVAFGQTLVEPNMLVIDVEKFASAPAEGWFTIDERPPIAYVKVEILEGADMKPSDLNGLSDPYVKGQLGPYRFQTKIQRKTLAPKWHEEFRVPISSWEAPNLLALQVRDKDHIFDDVLGDCSVDISKLRGGQRHDKWVSLQNIKMGRLHLGITVLEDELDKANKDVCDDEVPQMKETATPESDCVAKNQNTDESLEDYRKMSDEYEPINIEGQEKTGIWVHHPGSDVSQTWEPRKGRVRYPETQLHREDNECTNTRDSSASGSHCSVSSNNDEKVDGNKFHQLRTIKKGLQKIGSVFHKSPRKESPRGHAEDAAPAPRPNIQPLGEKRTSVNFVVDDNCSGSSGELDKGEMESPSKGHLKGMAKNIVKQAGKSAHSLKSVLSKKGSNKFKEEQPSEADKEDVSEGSKSPNDLLNDDPLVVGGFPLSEHDKEPTNAKEGSSHQSPEAEKDDMQFTNLGKNVQAGTVNSVVGSEQG